MARGEDTGRHPGRQVGPDTHPHALQARGVPAGAPWHSGFVGDYYGNVDNHGYFSAEATGGGSTDSLQVPFKGNPSMIGKRMAVLPSESGGDIRKGAHVMSLDDTSDHSAYSHLPGYK